MLDFFETVRRRHSVRKFRNDLPVEPEKLHAILEMADAAPSAGDLQAYKIIVVTGQDKRNALSELAGGEEFIRQAPVCLIFCTDSQRSESKFGARGKSLYALQDTTIAATYAQLAVVASGLGSTWVGNFDEANVVKELDISPSLVPVAMLSIGYAAELPEPTPRRKLDEVIEYR